MRREESGTLPRSRHVMPLQAAAMPSHENVVSFCLKLE